MPSSSSTAPVRAGWINGWQPRPAPGASRRRAEERCPFNGGAELGRTNVDHSWADGGVDAEARKWAAPSGTRETVEPRGARSRTAPKIGP